MTSAVLSTLALAAPAGAEARTGAPWGCAVDVYYEVDAHGYVTGYPAAVCGGRGSAQYVYIKITASITRDAAAFLDSSDTSYVKDAPYGPGTYPGIGVRARKLAGRQEFCTHVDLRWALGGPAQSTHGKACARY
ncbi:hypothetical protein [Prauserella shujinwangii]|uniref:hypothetical protein n=1 Tax=Prauserella shujinwangii TaxID=1453103 RepID=UPI0011B28012|nr:hypothetical protein [Prauserella shujinwangii]